MVLINGSYGKLKTLPATAGREGVGKVIEVGAEVDEKVIGKIVAIPETQGAWQKFVVSKADTLILLPSTGSFGSVSGFHAQSNDHGDYSMILST